MPTIGNAPSGENTSLAGTEKVPVSGSQFTLISTIATYLRTLAQTLTNKTISLTSNTLTGTKAEFNTAVSDGDIAFDAFKTISVSGQSDVVADSATDTLTLAAGSNVTLTTNATTDTVTIAASGGNAFGTISVSGQSDVVADAAPDTLTLAAGSNITLTTNAGTDTVTIAASGGNAFGTVAVSGQSDVVADAAPDTLTLAAGTGITLTTNAGTDTVTIAASGSAFVLNVNTTPVGNVGAGEDDLITYSVAGNTLDTNGQYIHFAMGGTFAASANNKRVRVKFGTTTLFDTGALAITSAGDWNVEGYIIRTGSATQKCIVEFESNETALAGSADYVDGTEDLTTSLTLKATGEATDNDDVIQKFLIVEKGGGAAGGGTGDVVGPGSATDNAIARFDSTTGKLIQNSAVTIDDSGTVNIPTGQTYNLNGSTIIDDTAYDATSWNGDTTHAPSKNAVRDKIESLSISIWTQDVNESGTSFTNWTGATGTWSSDGTVIKQTDTASTVRRAKYNTAILVGSPLIFEAEIQIRTAGGIGGIIIGFDGSSAAGALLRINEGSELLEWILDNTTSEHTSSNTINTNTWYKVRAVCTNNYVTGYLDGTLKGTGGKMNNSGNASFIGLWSFAGEVWWRNIKAWTLSGGLPA